MEGEHRRICRLLKKQEYDFRTIFECVKQVSARSLEVDRMLKYVMRTMMGQFGVYRVLVLRVVREESARGVLRPVGSIGVRAGVPDAIVNAPEFGRFFSHQGVFPATDLDDPLFAERDDFAWRSDFEAFVPLLNEDRSAEENLEGLVFLGKRITAVPFYDNDKEFLSLLANVVAISFRNETLYRRSIIDDLTQVHSRGRLDAQLAHEVNRVDRYDVKGIAFLMLDVDHFKTFNDKHGHQTGDLVLKSLAETLKKQVRLVDVVARYGGEEFAVILLEIDRKRTIEVAHRILDAVNQMRIKPLSGEGELSIHVSVGVACYPGDAANKQELVKKADMALYRAKEKGRNRVEIA